MNQNNINSSIAKQMELLSTLGMELTSKLLPLAQACTDTLLNGGKLIVISDPESRHCDTLLSHIFGKGEIIERPPLPIMSLQNVAASQHEQSSDVLSHIYQSHDLIITIARDATNLNLGSALKHYHCYGIHCVEPAERSTPQLLLNITDRAQWHVGTALLCNLLVQDIEQLLFGLNNHD